ncbi:MAG: DNA replication/repair protein RecF [Chloroflexi bacterium]|nr:DNA replication/repair protein RecF [Chloroflexota bacterium]
MHLSHLALANFRSFQSLRLDLPPGLVVIHGANGQGKSNLLEAAYLLSIAKSYRTNVERELMSWEAVKAAEDGGPAAALANQTIVSGDVETTTGRLRIIVGLRLSPEGNGGGTQAQKEIRVNGAATSASGLVGQMNAVLFTAADVDLVLGPPSGRRRFLDILISQADRPYLRALQRYQRVLAQRNSLLRQVREGHAAADELDFWDAELAKEGSAVIARRDEVVGRLSPLSAEAYRTLAGGEAFSLAYQPSVSAGTMAQAVAGNRAAEVRAGLTLSGPHRDDLLLAIDGMPAATYASRGQARTIGLALRLAEATFLREARRQEPVLLLDDVLSELDPQRRRRVLEEAARCQQAIVTTAEPALAREGPASVAAVVRVEKGRVETA